MNELNFNDIPADIKSKIFKINKDAEQEEGSTRTYEHLNGKFINVYKCLYPRKCRHRIYARSINY